MSLERGYIQFKKKVPIFTGLVNSDLRPAFHLSPFHLGALDAIEKSSTKKNGRKLLADFFSTNNFTITESGRSALFLLLNNVLKLDKNDCVTIVKSLSHVNSHYISSCVTKTIEKVCHWSQEIEKNTRVVLVIHEFGYPYPLDAIEKYRDYIIVEDFAYGFGSQDKKITVGTCGDYAIGSLSKNFPLQYGGILLGTKMKNVLPVEQEKYLEKVMALFLSHHKKILKYRQKNWKFLEKSFLKLKLKPLVVPPSNVNPGVFILDCRSISRISLEKLLQVKQTLLSFGVENTVYYPLPALILPCHQELGKASLEYLIAAVNFSLCQMNSTKK